jgi:hypothetical protein
MKIPALAFLLWVPLLPVGGAAQAPPDGWNAERALELIQRAQQRRAETFADTGLVNYQADARIYVYFYLDREDTGERNLVKTDQLALEVFWQAPDQVKQRIVGWRDAKSLPTNINYHLDHLTVVQENFGDEIRLGDGDEVRGVPHPAAAGAEQFYQYRLTDSLTLRLPGTPEPLRVYELQVRPRDPSQPALVGSVFVDRREGDIVRMDFTFTAAAYVDRYLDYINISLENGLWRGRFWLPNQQRVEIRRRIPQLDIPAGSVIRANMRIGDYEFNEELPPFTFAGPPVVTVPVAQREAFEFEEGLFEEISAEGLGPQVELAEIRRRAAELAREQALRRVSGVRLRLPRFSEVVRYNRAEGLALGLGLTTTPVPGLRLGVQGGYAFGADHPLAALHAEAGTGRTRGTATAYLNRPRDLGVGPVVSGAVNTLTSLFAAEDYLDLFYADGAEIGMRHRLSPSWMLVGQSRVERQSSASLEADFAFAGGDFRPVQPVSEADLFVGASLGLRRSAPSEAGSWWEGALWMDAGRMDPGRSCALADDGCFRTGDKSYLQPRAELSLGRRWGSRGAEARLEARAGLSVGEIPLQGLYRIGGRGTVPGYDFRSFGGDRFWAAQATASAPLWEPWVRGRVLGALGWTGLGEAGEHSLERSGLSTTGAVRPSLGAGVGIFHDILRVDLARGLGEGGRWELILETQPSFWDFL